MRFYKVQALIRGAWYEWIVLALSNDAAMRAVERSDGFEGVPTSMEAFECELQAAVIAYPPPQQGGSE